VLLSVVRVSTEREDSSDKLECCLPYYGSVFSELVRNTFWVTHPIDEEISSPKINYADDTNEECLRDLQKMPSLETVNCIEVEIRFKSGVLNKCFETFGNKRICFGLEVLDKILLKESKWNSAVYLF
jgi:hypothetical protein